MNTEQNYVGRGNYANPTEPKGTTNPQTAKNKVKFISQVDNRSANESSYVDVNRTVYEAQTKLLELVDDFMGLNNSSGPIEAINDLLYEWLTTPDVDLSNRIRKDQLSTVLSLVNFLTKLYESINYLEYVVSSEREVNRD